MMLPTSEFAHVRIAQSLLLVLALSFLSGCATHRQVLARADTRFNLNASSKITLAGHPHPTETELALERDLIAALHEIGIDPVPQKQAEFTLAYWLDDSWKRGKRVEYYYHGRWTDTDPMDSPRPVIIGPYGNVYTQEPEFIQQRVVDVPYYVQGIRLKLYPVSATSAGNFQTAWEGYIEGGDRVSQRRELVLLRKLLQYFGRNFDGKVDLRKMANSGD